MTRHWAAAAAMLALAIAYGEARAERFDHRGSVGLLLEPGFSVESTTDLPLQARLFPTLGGTLAVGHADTELLLLLSPGVFQKELWLQVSAGVRMFYGYERLKTFLDLTATVTARPLWSAGPRIGGGFQYELSPLVGVYAGAAAAFGFGQGIHLGGEIFGGVQLRSYLLEG